MGSTDAPDCQPGDPGAGAGAGAVGDDTAAHGGAAAHDDTDVAAAADDDDDDDGQSTGLAPRLVASGGAAGCYQSSSG